MTEEVVKLTPFDFINSISHTKDELIRKDGEVEDREKQYVAFVINKGLSHFQDSILHVNEMNMRPGLRPDAQYRYLKAALRSKKRYAKWTQADKNEIADVLQQVFDCNRKTSKMYARLFDAHDLENLNTLVQKGG